jgi:hypothetical protein
MGKVTIDQMLIDISTHLHLSKETEYELLAEIRTHLEDEVAKATAKGEDEQIALLKAAERFGIDEVGLALQEVHEGWESVNALLAVALPVLLALILRWLAYAPDGSALAWPQLLVGPGFWIVAGAALIIPFLRFRRWSLALIGWGFFWLLSVIFIVLPVISQW